MIKYFLVVIGLISITSFQFKSNQSQLDNEFLFVIAPNGLNLRATPNGKKLLTIPYNVKVERLDKESYGTLIVEEIKGFNISGDWVKVKYDGQIGCVFDGYLTQFLLPEKGIESTNFDVKKYHFSEYNYYLKNNFEDTSKKYDLVKPDNEYDCMFSQFENCVCGYTQDFSWNITYRYWSCGEAKGLEENLKIEGITLAEAYFIVKVIDSNSSGAYYTSSDEEYIWKETITYDKSNKIIEIKPPGAGCYTTIKQTDTGVEISIFCGC